MDWSQLVEENLLSSGAVSGVAVVTKTGNCVYTQGLFDSYQEQDWSQFCGLFSTAATATEDVPKLSLKLEKKVYFVVFQKGQCSVYATSGGGVYSLVVCSLSVGVLVCVAQAPTLFSQTVSSAEHFATLLRN